MSVYYARTRCHQPFSVTHGEYTDRHHNIIISILCVCSVLLAHLSWRTFQTNSMGVIRERV